MTDRQENTLSMYEEVILYSDSNTTAISTVPAYAVVLTAFKNIVNEIKSLDYLIKQPTEYFAANKDSLKKQVAAEASNIAKALKAYANFENTLSLFHQTDFTKSQLESMRDEELPQVLSIIWGTANHHVSSLGDYGITTARLTSFSDLITQYNSSGSQPRNAIVNRKTNIEALPDAFKRGNSLLKNQLDGLAAQITFETFYQGYKNARIIVDSGTRNTKVDGTVINAVNSDPIAGVSIRVFKEDRIFSGISGVDGSFVIKTPVTGEVNVLFEKSGYQDMQTNITLVKGETTHMGNVQMVPAP